jgi:hypothetical protein
VKEFAPFLCEIMPYSLLDRNVFHGKSHAFGTDNAACSHIDCCREIPLQWMTAEVAPTLPHTKIFASCLKRFVALTNDDAEIKLLVVRETWIGHGQHLRTTTSS